MVKYRSAALDAIFSALSDPTRRGIVAQLARGESTVSELAEPFAMSLPAVSKHLRVLEEAGLLERTKSGRNNRCRLQPKPMKEASDWIDQYRRFWDTQFDNLAHHLATKPEETK